MKKSCALAPLEFEIVADQMSKTALIDLVYDYITRNLGEGESDDPRRTEQLLEDANVILKHRGDSPLKMATLHPRVSARLHHRRVMTGLRAIRS